MDVILNPQNKLRISELSALEKDTGKKIRLVKFTNRVELETL